jgi:glycosyltransferase involved in cell wall biosynthesis
MIKLLFVQSSLEKGGITNHLMSIVKHLNRHEFEIEILCLSDEKSHSEWDSFERIGIPIHQLHIKRWYTEKRVVAALELALKEIKPQIIQTFTFRPSYFIGKYFSARFLTVGVLSSNIYQNYSDSYGRFIGKYIANQELKGLRAMHQVVGVAKHICKTFGSTLKLIAIQNGIETEQTLSVKDKSIFRKELNWAENEQYFVYVGSLIKRKNPAFLIDTFLKSKFKQKSNLVLIGTGKLYQSLQEKYQSEKSILFLGQQSQISQYLLASDAYVSASFSEGLPLAALEAMSVQLPCLLSDIPAHNELQQENENAKGIHLFQLENASSLSHLFENFVPFQFDYTVQTARQMTLAYENLYHQLCLTDGAI